MSENWINIDVAFSKIEFVNQRKMFVAMTPKSPVCILVLQMHTCLQYAFKQLMQTLF